MKVWNVHFGKTFDIKTVEAKNYQEAGKKATELQDSSERNDYPITKIELIAETDD